MKHDPYEQCTHKVLFCCTLSQQRGTFEAQPHWSVILAV